MQQNRVNQKPRHPNSSPVGPDVNDKKIYTNSEGERKRTQKQIGRRPCNNISYNPAQG